MRISRLFSSVTWHVLVACIICGEAGNRLHATTIAEDVERELLEIVQMCGDYRAEKGKFNSLDELKALVASKFKNREKVTGDRDILDPWGRPYLFCEAVDGSFVIVSLGDPDVDKPKLWTAVVKKR